MTLFEKLSYVQDTTGISSETLDWLKEIGYFSAPAATSHHGNHEGGLFEHSMDVANNLAYLTSKLSLKWERKESPWIVGLFHDICKTDDYIKMTREEYNFDSYQYNPNKIMDGHGDKSVIMLAGHVALTEEEAMCIRFHMGAFTDKEEWSYYSKAVHDYPNVLYTHTADMIASQIKGI